MPACADQSVRQVTWQGLVKAVYINVPNHSGLIETPLGLVGLLGAVAVRWSACGSMLARRIPQPWRNLFALGLVPAHCLGTHRA